MRIRRTATGFHAVLVLIAVFASLPASGYAADARNESRMRALEMARPEHASVLAAKHFSPCVDGRADGYPCSNVDLMAFVPLATFSANSTNSLWGWTDPATEVEYALVGTDNGIAFFDLSLPDHPRYLGKLNSYTGSSAWRDVRVYANHAFVVSDRNGAHGMQVFDLTRLRSIGAVPQTFNEDAHYGLVGTGHTIAINEESGFAFIAGSDSCAAPTAVGGVHMVDIRNPLNPTFAGCIGSGGYTHETQCWIYRGADLAHRGKEICFNANGSSTRLAIVDVSNKALPITLSSSTYAGARFAHQAWLTEDHRYLLLNDELDESNVGHNARTYVWDVADLDAPVLVGFHQHALPVIDHNLYVHGNYVFASHYEAGLRILRIDNLSSRPPLLTEVAYFDTYPQGQSAQFNGNWNNFRFARSGLVIASGMDEGLFVLSPRLCTPPATPTALRASGRSGNRVRLAWQGSNQSSARFRIERAQGGCDGAFQTIADDLAGTIFTDSSASGDTIYGYRVSERGGDVCASVASACVTTSAKGACTAGPLFSGVANATDSGQAQCRIDLAWNPAISACGTGVTYSVYRGSHAGFVPNEANRIATALTTAQFIDPAPGNAIERHYLVRAVDTSNGASDGNMVTMSARATGPLVPGVFSAGAEFGDPAFDDGGSAVAAQGKLYPIAKHAGWHPSAEIRRSGTFSYWSTRANNLCSSLVSPTIQLQAGMAPMLSYWQAFGIESGFDGGVVEISADNGQSWARLTPVGGYPGIINGGGTLCGIAPGEGAVTGSNWLAFTQSGLNLSAYAGQSVRLRWLYRSDEASAPDPGGWYLDDISISHAMVPGTCAASPSLQGPDQSTAR